MKIGLVRMGERGCWFAIGFLMAMITCWFISLAPTPDQIAAVGAWVIAIYFIPMIPAFKPETTQIRIVEITDKAHLFVSEGEMIGHCTHCGKTVSQAAETSCSEKN